MDYLKVREAALKYQISEKTIRKWITSKQLPSTTRVVNGIEQYALLAEDIETLIAEKSLEPKSPALVELAEGLQTVTSGQDQVPSPDREQITALASELSYQSEMIEAMKQELEALQARVTALEQGQTRGKRPAQRFVIEDVNYQVPASATQPAESKRVQTPKQDTTSTRPLLPANWSSWTPFVERHNVSSESRRLLKAVNKADYCEPGEYMQMSARGGQVVKCGLSPDGQSRLLTAIKALPALAPDLKQCDVEDCPCHQVLGKTLWDE